MKKQIKISVTDRVSFTITEEEFVANDKAGTLDVLFNPLINFAGDAAFSGPNWYADIQHEGHDHYTLKLQPNVSNGRFMPGVSNAVMQKLYGFIRNDIAKNVARK